MNAKNLKLIAKTDEDLRVISAHLQDSITQVKNIAHLRRNRILLIQFNRFMWEDVEKGVFRKNKRIRTILKFENVIKVLSKNINQSNMNEAKSKSMFLSFGINPFLLGINIDQTDSSGLVEFESDNISFFGKTQPYPSIPPGLKCTSNELFLL